MKFIKATSSEYMGGGNWVDCLTLSDGRVLAVNDDAVVLFDDMVDFDKLTDKDRQIIDLRATQ